ncbi:Retrovirus-related Pol polyprotein from transposon 17.6 [Mytilus coruscus]|uniref:Retrovirus-related Pol polyprotein from transposon 17.6 n=1 Tax=Mytilus coruscus TaxID=42192 RepID=A0A6J8A6C3_MYTCO|nr:Retrovirus-related Pol polyprotein from transposon 17.6 [Mytilus coruscus]
MVMAQVLRGINWKFVLCYVDDILVFSENFETHLDHLQQLFNCLSKANLTLKPSKCSFAVTEVKYLGHVISKEGVKVDPEKTSAVATFPEPKTQKDVRSFLGMCNYYRKFVQSYSKITTPLTELLKKDVQIRWTLQCQIAFDNLKTRLTSSPILAYADMNKPFEIICDASDYAIGHMLIQKDDQNRSRVIAYGGRSQGAAERKYHTTEKECLAIVNAIKNNDTYLSNNRFIIHTDHQALCWLQNTKHKSGRLLRWAMALQHYTFDIKHIKGKDNTCVDALSRRTYPETHPDQDQMEDGPKSADIFTLDDTKREITEVHFFYDHDPDTVIAAVQDDNSTVQIEQKEDIGTLQRKCPDFEDIYAYLKDGTLPENNKLARKVNIESQQYSILNGILYHWYQRRTKKPEEQARQHQQLALPRVLRDDALLAYHDSQSGGAHLATKRVYEALKLKMSPATKSTEYSPYYLLFGKEMNLPFDVDVQPKDNMGKEAKEHIQEVIDKLKIAKEIATDNVNRRQEKNKEHYDKS